MIKCPFLYGTLTAFHTNNNNNNKKKTVSCSFCQVYLLHSNSLAHKLY